MYDPFLLSKICRTEKIKLSLPFFLSNATILAPAFFSFGQFKFHALRSRFLFNNSQLLRIVARVFRFI